MQLPVSLGIGDWVYFRCMGAYTLAAGSTFNGMPRPGTVHVCGEIAARRLTGEGRCDIILCQQLREEITTLNIDDDTEAEQDKSCPDNEDEDNTASGFTKYSPGAGFAATVRALSACHEICEMNCKS